MKIIITVLITIISIFILLFAAKGIFGFEPITEPTPESDTLTSTEENIDEEPIAQ